MEFKNYLERLARNAPIVHCITNTVTVNDCANAVLAIGARPVMAEHPAETARITAAADALLINMGSLTDSKIAAMRAAVKSAKRNGVPFVVDCVGIASSDIRLETARELIAITAPAVIKGNAAEIRALCEGVMSESGVDSTEPETDADERAARIFAKRHNTVVMTTGPADVITDGDRTARVKNGCEMMAKITGTGCMLGCVTAAFTSVADAFDAAVYAAVVMGVCGEAADRTRGTGTFRMTLMDNLSMVTDGEIMGKINLEM